MTCIKRISIMFVIILLLVGCNPMNNEQVRPVDQTVEFIEKTEDGLEITTGTINSGTGYLGHETRVVDNKLYVKVLDSALVTDDTRDNPPLTINADILETIDQIYLEDDQGNIRLIWQKPLSDFSVETIGEFMDVSKDLEGIYLNTQVAIMIEILKVNTTRFIDAYDTKDEMTQGLLNSVIQEYLVAVSGMDDLKRSIDFDSLDEKGKESLNSILGPQIINDSPSENNVEEKVISFEYMEEIQWNIEEIINGEEDEVKIGKLVQMIDVDQKYNSKTILGFMGILPYVDGAYAETYVENMTNLLSNQTEEFLTAYLSLPNASKKALASLTSGYLSIYEHEDIIHSFSTVDLEAMDMIEKDALTKLVGFDVFNIEEVNPKVESVNPIFIAFPGDNQYIFETGLLVGGASGDQWFGIPETIDLMKDEIEIDWYSNESYKGSRVVKDFINPNSVIFDSISSNGEVLMGINGDWDAMPYPSKIDMEGRRLILDFDNDGIDEIFTVNNAKIVVNNKLVDGITLNMEKDSQSIFIDEVEMSEASFLKVFSIDLNGDQLLEIALVINRDVYIYSYCKDTFESVIDYD